MYSIVLLLHSWIRWVAVVAGVGATVIAAGGRGDKGGPVDKWGLVFLIAMDLQLLLGLLLYFVISPNMEAIRANFGASMRDPAARFWAVEHVGTMLVAVILVHLGRVLARKASTAASRRTRLLICFGLATIAMLAAIPWPGMTSGRPLFRYE